MIPDVRSILLLHAGAVGDTILALHAARAVQRVFPHAALSAAARCRVVHWFAQQGVLRSAFDLDALRLHPLYVAQEPLPVDSGLLAHDLILNFLAGPQAPLSRHLAAATPSRVYSVDPRATPHTVATGTHISDQWIAELVRQGLPAAITAADDGGRPSFGPSGPFPSEHLRPSRDPESRSDDAHGVPLPEGQEAVPSTRKTAVNLNFAPDEVLVAPRPDRRGIICHPGSGGAVGSKCAPIEDFENVVRQLRHRDIVRWMVGPAEHHGQPREYFSRLSQSAPLIDEPDLGRAVEELAGARAYVGNDSGMTHVAAALGLRTVALFGPTDPAVWRPIGPDVHVFRFPLAEKELLSVVERLAV